MGGWRRDGARGQARREATPLGHAQGVTSDRVAIRELEGKVQVLEERVQAISEFAAQTAAKLEALTKQNG